MIIMQKEVVLDLNVVASVNVQKLRSVSQLIGADMHEHKEVGEEALHEVLVLSLEVTLHVS